MKITPVHDRPDWYIATHAEFFGIGASHIDALKNCLEQMASYYKLK